MDHLGPLIFSLSKEEKARFTRYSTMLAGKRQDHLSTLYQHILKEQQKGRMNWKARLPSHLVPRIDLYSSRLMARILESQRERLPTQSVEAKVRSLLSEIDYLYRKKLLDLCRRKLRQAKKLARSYAIESLLMDVLKWEYKLLLYAPKANRDVEYQRIQAEVEAGQQRLRDQWTLRNLEEQTLSLARRETRIRTPEVRQSFLDILAHPLLELPIPPDNFPVWHTAHLIRGVYQTCLGDYSTAIEWLRPLFEAWEGRPKHIVHEPQTFLRVCNAFLGCMVFSEAHFEELSTLFERIRKQAKLSPDMQLEFEQLSYYQELLFSINYLHGAPLRALLTKAGAWLNENEAHINSARKTVLQYNLTIGAFCLGDLRLARHWNNRLLEERKERLDIADFARIFQMILLFEQGENDLNEYLSRSAYRFFKRTQKLEDFERTIIRAIDAVSGNAPPGTLQDVFRGVQASLESLARRPGERNPIGLSIVSVWVQGKMEGRSVAAIMAENAQNLRDG